MEKYKEYLTRRNVIIGAVAFAGILFLVIFISNVNSRRSHASELRVSAEQLVTQANSILENTPALAPEDKMLLGLLTPSTLSQEDLVKAVDLLAQQLNLVAVPTVQEAETLTNEQALAALDIDPTTFSSDFEIVSAAVDVVADMPRLIRFVDLVRNSRVTGPLMGISKIHFSLNGNESVATLHIVGVRFVAGSTAPTTTVPSEMTMTP
jgi:hypothetical protein